MVRAEETDLGHIAQWFYGAADRWPDVFDPKDLSQIFNWAHEHVYEKGVETESERRQMLVRTLRAGLLKRERAAVNRCTGCALHQNRLPGRGVFDDGDFDNDIFAQWENGRSPISTTSAEIMVVGEGPGAFEQRTGFPFVSYQGLAGASICARDCDNYSTCFNKESKFPQGTCKPALLRKGLKERGTHPDEIEDALIQIRTERANTPLFPIQTAGNRLDLVIFKTGLWREVWNAKARLQGKATKPGTVYVCNAVKCRSCDASGKDKTPGKKDVQACYQWLQMQLYIIQPRVIVALGNAAIAITTAIEDPKVLSLRGKIYPCPWMQIPVVLDVHPSFIIRQTDAKAQEEYTQGLIQSFELAKQIVAGEVALPWEKELDEAMQAMAAEGYCPNCGRSDAEHTPNVAASPFAEGEEETTMLQCPRDEEPAVTQGTGSFLDEDEQPDLAAEAAALKQEIIDELLTGDEQIMPSKATFIPTEPDEENPVA